MDKFLRKYGVQTTVVFDLFEVDGVDFRVDAVHASGDTKIMKDEGAEANTSNGFTDEGTGYSIVLTATEMQAARIKIYFVDQTATKVWLDKSITIETYGHASAMHAFDLGTASTAQTGDSFAIVNSGTHGNSALKTLIDTIDGIVDNILTDTGTTLDGKIDTIDTVVDAIKAVTDNLPDSGALTALIAYVDTIETTLANATYGLANLKTLIDTIDNFVDTEVASIKAVTDKLDDTLEDDAGTYRFTENALEQAPSGTGASAASIADAVWDEAIADHVAAGSFGAKNQKVVPSETINDYKADVSALATAAALATVDTIVDAIKAKTDNLPADPADDSDIDSQLATIVGYLDTEVAAIKAKTDNLPTDPADQSAVEAAITTAHSTTDGLLNTIAGYLDTEIAAILEDTGTTIPALIAALNDPAASAIADAVLDEVLADLADNSLNAGEDITPRKALRGLFNRFFREVTQTGSAQVVKNDSGTQIATMAVSDDDTTQTKGIAT